MKLYYAPGACSLAVHSALREVGVPFEGVAVDLAKHTTAGGANWANFLALPLTPYPHLSAYLARVSQRPRVQEALHAEGLTE